MSRRMKIYSFILIYSLVFPLCFSGCGDTENLTEFVMSLRARNGAEERRVTDDEMSAKATEEHWNQSWVETGEDELPYKLEDIEEAYQIILEQCSGEFIGYHPMDEMFLAWFSDEYGSESLLQIAEAVKSGKQDKNLWYELTGNSIQVLWLLYCRQTGFQQYALENVTWQLCASSSEITMAFTGDVNFAEGYVTTAHMDQCENGIYDCFSEDLLEVMNGVDVMMVNNEFTYSTRGTALPGKAYTFRADPSRVELMKVFGTDIVNVANNHVYDFGPDALLDTIATLDEAGIPHVGAGANIEEAGRPYYFVCNGRKIAIVSATQIERSKNYTKEATEDSPGVLKTLDPEKFVEVIKKARKNSDYVIAMVHWGTEGDSNYGKDQYNLAQAFVAAGADAIIGGHTHCLQGFAYMDGVPIIYSLGNFWFSSSTQDTGLAKVTIDESGKLKLSFIPCIQENIKTSLVTDAAQRQRILDFMRQHSADGVTVTEDGEVQEALN